MEHLTNDLTQVLEQCKQTIDLQDKSHSNPYLIPNPELAEYSKLQYSQLECAKHHVDAIEQLLTNALSALDQHDTLHAEEVIQTALQHVNAQTTKSAPMDMILCEPVLAG
ncbi:hypothetical protein [Photobacterium kagoshimensis]|uniref:hypothetical protein n=1 Tax=Photobacterium kagoshimensis TaxID=2910242 RepID=UPI003D1316C0